MTRVIHTGDTHLGYRQYHLPERREDFLDAFRQVAADAVADDVDAVVHAGDLFHDRRPGLSDLLGAQSVLERLDDAGVPFLAVVGNHETKRESQWLDLFEAMGLATRLGDEPVVVGDTAFYGLDFVPRSRRDGLDYEFAPHDADHAALVSHGLFEPLVPDYGNVEWDAAEVLAAATVDFDAMLLGDEHAPTRQAVDGRWVTYCGSTERASADERDERGYNIVEFDNEAHVARRGIETREFVFVELELAEDEGFDRVRRRLRERTVENAVVHVELSGDGEAVSAARIEEFADDEGALVARVADRREVDEEADTDVVFADPDEAVRERVRELGLSEAARDLDETIRAGKVADANVADEVERRVGELLEEPAAFDAAADPETVADRLADGGDGGDGSDGGEGDDDPGGSTDTDADDGADADADASTTDGGADGRATDGETGAERPTDDDGADASAEATADDGAASDDQASMEDYL
jgi:DNA repair exonuclease SbcCD nuclease subunit